MLSVVADSAAPDPGVPPPRFRWGTRVGLPAAILAGFALLFGGALAGALRPVSDVEAVPVVERPALLASAAPVGSAVGGDGEVVVQAAGWIEPDPFPLHVTALASGVVSEVLVREGDAVTSGQVLARLVPDDARLALRRAEVEHDAALESWHNAVEATRRSTAADAAAREADAALELARAELDVQHALLVEAERLHQRRSELLAGGSISTEEAQTSETARDAQAARVRAAERRVEVAAAALDSARAEAAAARRDLELRTEERRRLGLAEVALAEARLRVARLEVRAPIDGVVLRRLVEPGSPLMTDAENAEMSRVAEVYDPARLQVRVDVPLADAGGIGLGQRARVHVEVLPDRPFEGVVSRITNRADIQKNTLEVKVALSNPAAELKPEMLARVQFLARAAEGGAVAAPVGATSVWAPAPAVAGGGAWVVSGFDGEAGTAARRVVTLTGAESDGWAEVAGGLQPGDLVIVSAAGDLAENRPVRVRPKGGN
jgi:RND family efflux transporter MFP subunit